MLRAKITKGTPVRSMAHDSVKLAGRTYIVTVHRITPVDVLPAVNGRDSSITRHDGRFREGLTFRRAAQLHRSLHVH